MILHNGLLLWLALFTLPAQAATLTLDAETVTIEGRIFDADADHFVTLTYGKTISTVIFKNSSGGQWKAGQRLSNLIMRRGITSVVEGVCASSCAMAFLGGDVRRFGENATNPMLVFHAPFLPHELRPLESLKEAFFAWFEERTGKPLHPLFKKTIDAQQTPGGGVFLFPIGASKLTRLCTGNEEKIPSSCAESDGIDAASLGVVSHKKAE